PQVRCPPRHQLLSTSRWAQSPRAVGGNKSTSPSTTTTPSITTTTTIASTTAPPPSAPAPSQNNINPTGGNQFAPVVPANPPTAVYPHTRTPGSCNSSVTGAVVSRLS